MMRQVRKVAVLLGLATLALCPADASTTTPKKVLISKVVDHPALDATAKGIVDALAERGYRQDTTLDLRIESAQGNPVLAAQIASKFIEQKPDVAVAVGTLSAQSFMSAVRKGRVKLVFSTVTDPLGASLVKSLAAPKLASSGVSNFVDLEPQLSLFLQIQPTLKKLGILFNPAEVNSVAILSRLEKICQKMGLVLIKQPVLKTADAAQAATKLAQEVDAILISNDNTALAALQSIVRVATKARVPVYVSDTDAVADGALAALGPNQYDVGRQTGVMIADVLEGKDLQQIAVQFPTKTDLYLNLDTAKALGMTLPKTLLDKAARVIQKDPA